MHSTSDLKDGYIGSGKRLRYAIKKYGVENFKFEILEFCEDREKLIKREKNLITEAHINDENCYNLKYGGLGGGKFYSPEHQFKCSQAAGVKHRERLQNDEQYRLNYSQKLSSANKKGHREKIRKSIQEIYSWNGKQHKPETIEKIKLVKKGHGLGEKNSQFGTKWITNGILNKKIKKDDIVPDNWWYGITNTKLL
jgi:hypothetical protein